MFLQLAELRFDAVKVLKLISIRYFINITIEEKSPTANYFTDIFLLRVHAKQPTNRSTCLHFHENPIFCRQIQGTVIVLFCAHARSSLRMSTHLCAYLCLFALEHRHDIMLLQNMNMSVGMVKGSCAYVTRLRTCSHACAPFQISEHMSSSLRTCRNTCEHTSRTPIRVSGGVCSCTRSVSRAYNSTHTGTVPKT